MQEKEKRQPKYDPEKGFPKVLRGLLGSDRGKAAELAQALGVSKAAISNYTSGLTGVTPENLIAIAKHFGVSVDYLLGVSDIPAQDPDIKMIADYTGLSEESIAVLHMLRHGVGDYFTANKAAVKTVNILLSSLYLSEEEIAEEASNELSGFIMGEPAWAGFLTDVHALIFPNEMIADYQSIKDKDPYNDFVLFQAEKRLNCFIDELRDTYNPTLGKKMRFSQIRLGDLEALGVSLDKLERYIEGASGPVDENSQQKTR